MKQYLFIILFFLIPFFSKGQRGTNPVRYQVTVSTGIPMSTPSIVPFTLEGRVLYSFSSRFAAGVGTGFSLYDKEALIPLTGNLQFNLLKPGRFTPFLDCAAGYSFAPAASSGKPARVRRAGSGTARFRYPRRIPVSQHPNPRIFRIYV